MKSSVFGYGNPIGAYEKGGDYGPVHLLHRLNAADQGVCANWLTQRLATHGDQPDVRQGQISLGPLRRFRRNAAIPCTFTTNLLA
jgi:hypothetical protein